LLRRNPLSKVTGDNLDVYIKRDIISGMNRNKDIHLFNLEDGERVNPK
jgi:hypothetical protein